MEYGLVLWWLVSYLAFLAAGLPLAAALFPRLADRGAGVALPTALAVLWVVAYLVGHVSLSAGLWVGLAVLALASGVAVFSDGVDADVDLRLFGEVAVVFTAAFLFLVAIRSVDAGVHPMSGEKFLDFGLMKTVLRADALPPEDMWFAGRPVQYYYGGHFLAALLTRITGTEPRFAYNLALSGFYAMLVTAAYGLAGAVGASRGVSRVQAGAFGAFFVGFSSNLSTPGRFVVWLLPDGLSSFLAGLLGFEIDRLAASGPDGFWYWSASRVIDTTINEFPLFAWLNGDMHAHMMSAPFVVLVAALLFSYFRTPEDRTRRRQLLVFGAVPPVAGLLAVVNTWSLPTAGGLAFLTLALAPTAPGTVLPGAGRADETGRETDGDDGASPAWKLELARYWHALAGAAGVAVLAVAWSLPFWLGTASTRSVGFFPDRSSMGELLLVHGAFLALFGLYLLRHAIPHLDRDHAGEVAATFALAVVLAWGGASAAAVALVGPMIVVGWILLRLQADPVRRATEAAVDAGRQAVPDGGAAATAASGGEGPVERIRDTVGFETVLLVGGAGIVLIVEFVFVKEEAGPGRLNTVFKTYADVWVLWAVAAGAVIANLVENHSPTLALTGGRWRTGLRAFAVVLVVATAMYGAFAVPNHFSTDSFGNPNAHPENPTLDGFYWAQQEHGQEMQAVAWFDRLEGQPNIVSQPGRDMYQWTSPVSSLTGVPTLAGWAHERGYRGSDVYFSRAGDAQTIYTGSPEQRAYLLDVYDIEYVYVGSNERVAYSESNLAVFESMQGVTLEKEWGFIRVYRVDQDRLQYPDGGS